MSLSRKYPMVKAMKRRAPQKPERNFCKKSANNAFIYVLGQAGSGKSVTLNKIFGGREISPVERETGTQEVLEFAATLSDGDIRLIDTPGLGDINGLEWDAQIISTLEKFRNTHEELSTCIPNVVILAGRFDDNRIEGALSSFVKMIKSIDYQRSSFIDPHRNNLILLLTHVMNGKRSLRQEPEARLQLVKTLLKSYTHFPHEPIIVLAENEADDFGLKSADNESHVLPNGEIYPQNLLEAILTICTDSGDTHGAKLFTEAFSQRGTIPVKLHRSLPMLKPEDSQNYIPFLSDLYMNTRSTVMFDQLNIEWNAMNKSCTDPGYQRLLRVLEEMGCKNYAELPSDWKTQLTILTQMNYDSSLMHLAENVLGFKQPALKSDGVGYSYNLGQDCFSNNTPIDFNNHESSELFRKLPSGISYHPNVHQLETELITFHIFNNRQEYSAQRVKDLQIEDKQIQSEGRIKSGYNVINEVEPRKQSNQANRKMSKEKPAAPMLETITIVKEFRIGKLKYTVSDHERVNSSFISEIRKLPPFSKSRNRLISNKWRELFSKYGTHVVTSAYVGGAIELKIDCEQLKRELKLNEIDKHNADFIKRELSTLFEFHNMPKFSTTTGLILSAELVGGIHNQDMKAQGVHLFQIPYAERQSQFTQWKESLKMNPVTLSRRGMQLVELKQYIEKVFVVDTAVRAQNLKKFKSPSSENQITHPIIKSYDEAIKALLSSIPRKAEKYGTKCSIA